MAVQYQAMTTTTGASVQLANGAFLTAFKNLAVANSAWSTVEDNSAVGSNNLRYLCLKNDHTISGAPADFYVLFVFNPTSGTNITGYVGESYNSTTHVLSGTVGIDSASAFAIDASGKLPTPGTAGSNGTTGAVATTGSLNPLTFTSGGNATTVFWQAVVYNDHFVLASAATSAANTAGTSYYIGSYTSLVPTPATNDPVRIGLFPLGASSLGGFTREPLQVASTTRTHPTTGYGPTSSGIGTGLFGEFARACGTTSYDYFQASYPVSRFVIFSTSTLSGGTAGISTRGILNDLVVAAAVPTSLTNGDTVTYNGHSWVAITTATIASTTNWVYVDSGS